MVPTAKRLSKSEWKSLWYSAKELKRMRLDLRCSLKNLALSENASPPSFDDGDDGEHHNYESFHWRGLEHIQKGTMSSSLESRQCLVQGVLSLQKLHKVMGLQDDIGLTLFTRAYTKEATQRAQDIAKQDSDEALQIYNEGKAEQVQLANTNTPFLVCED